MIDPTKLTGRELDAAIAQEIFDWKWISNDAQQISILADPAAYVIGTQNAGYYLGKAHTPSNMARHYSADDALALQAADKAGLFFPKLYTLLARQDTFAEVDDPPIWIVATCEAIYDYEEGMESKIEGIATGTTRAEALCRAALILAMEGK